MSALALDDSSELALAAELIDAKGRDVVWRAVPGDSVIIIHLGPGQKPEIARILRSQWPTVTALNYSQEREFHVRLRQHKGTGICIVYASIGNTKKKPSIFGDVVQRGRLARTHDQIKAAIAEIKKELGIESPGMQRP